MTENFDDTQEHDRQERDSHRVDGRSPLHPDGDEHPAPCRGQHDLDGQRRADRDSRQQHRHRREGIGEHHGGMVRSVADSTTRSSGGNVKSEAKANNVVKGAMVMLNPG